MCSYCGNEIPTLNFARHLQRQHLNEKEVRDIMQYPKNSKARREGFALLRNEINFDLYMKGVIRPYRQHNTNFEGDVEYYPCAHCKGVFDKKYLRRHAKNCIARYHHTKQIKTNHISQSQTTIACAMDVTNTISKLNVKEQVCILGKLFVSY